MNTVSSSNSNEGSPFSTEAVTSILYGIDRLGILYQINPASGEATQIGDTGLYSSYYVYSPIDIEFDSKGTLYAVTQGTSVGGNKGDTLYTIDPTTALLDVEPVGKLGTSIFQFNGNWEGDLAFDSTNNRLYGISTIGDLYTVDRSTGDRFDLGNIVDNRYSTYEIDFAAMSFDNEGRLYVIDTYQDQLYEVNPISAEVLSVIDLVGADLGDGAGMDLDPVTNQLYVADGQEYNLPGPTYSLYTLDVETGHLSTIGPLFGTEGGLVGLAFSPPSGNENDLEPNDTIPEATYTNLMGAGTFSISTEIGDNPNLAPENDVDLFALPLNSGDRLLADIDAWSLGSDLDPILSVFDSKGVLVAQNDDNFDLDSLIDFTAATADTYYVGVSSYSNFDYNPFIEGSGSGLSSGFYNLSLTVETPALPA